MNSKLKTLLELWPGIVAGYHKSCDHYWQIVCEWNVLSDEETWWLKHDGYCYSGLEFGPFKFQIDIWNWDAEELREKMLDICHDELLRSEEEGLSADMPVEHWKQLIEKLQNL